MPDDNTVHYSIVRIGTEVGRIYHVWYQNDRLSQLSATRRVEVDF